MRQSYSSADLHIHTTSSDGTARASEVLEWASESTDLSVLAICDHNTNEGGLEASRIAHGYQVEVVVGQEVESTHGHILGLWTPENVNPGMSPRDTVDAIHEQGGLAIIAHPFAPRWWHRHGLCRGDQETYDAINFDGIEVANSTPMMAFGNVHARRYWKKNRHRLAATGGSDAHMAQIIGTSRTLFEGSTAAHLRAALESRSTRGWGPSYQPFRNVKYATRIPEIRRRDAERKQREAAEAPESD